MEAMLKVPKGQDPYNVIGQYIQNHITAIEDIIATIELDGMRTNELFVVDMQKDGYFVWKDDWWEGEEDVALLDFFPVSDAVPERKTQPEIIRCKDCKYLLKWRSEESARKFGQLYECAKGVLMVPVPEDFCSCSERRKE